VSDLDVAGGTGGIAARLDDMTTMSQVLSRIGVDLDLWSLSVASAAGDSDLLESAILSPVTAAAAEVQILAAAAHLRAMAISTQATGLFLVAAVGTYEAVDQALAGLALMRDKAVGYVVGAGLVIGSVFAAAGAVATAVIAVPVALAVTGVDAYLRIEQEVFTTVRTGKPFSVDEILDGMQGDLDAFTGFVSGRVWPAVAAVGGQAVKALTPYTADLTQMLASGIPGLLAGLSFAVPPWVTMAASGATGAQPLPPLTYQESVARIVGQGQAFGQVDDGTGFKVNHLTDRDRTQRADSGIKNLFEWQTDIDKPGADLNGDGLGDDAGRIRITAVPQPDGSNAWIVQIPGTQSWTVNGTPNLADLTTGLLSMAGHDTEYMKAVEQAMHDAGIPAGEPVMLVGHSLGGITAAAITADPSAQSAFNITHVITAGSPIDRIPIPSDVQVLAVQNVDDVVPRLDGIAANDQPNRTTVTFSTGTSYSNPGEAHDPREYEKGGKQIDASHDASISTFRDSASAFFNPTGGDVTVSVSQYQVTRTNP
jgi:hypothetical protein